MKEPATFITLIFAIQYSSGHLYYDRCGQTLLDIENNLAGWVGGLADVNTGTLDKIDKAYRVGFSANKFDFSAQRAYKDEIISIAKEASEVWKIINANLGLGSYIRIGCRFLYILPTETIDDAEKKLEKSELNIRVPKTLESEGYKVKTRHSIAVLKRDDMEYRLDLNAVTRLEGMDPSSLFRSDPRLLSNRRKEYRLKAIKRAKEYSRDPMHGVQLDIDCAQYEPETVNVEKYISEQDIIVKNTFLPILEQL